MWEIAAKRSPQGRLINVFDTNVRYTDNTAYKYRSCLVNTMQVTVQNEQEVMIDLNIIGGADASTSVRQNINADPQGNYTPTFLSSARTVTWNDFVVRIFDTSESINIPGDFLRSFNVTINNNVKRYMTLNGKLGPQDVAASKRTIEGSLTMMGFYPPFNDFIYNNQDRFTSNSKIAFGYKLGSNSSVYWSTALWGVVFNIEEVAISNEIIDTNIKFIALGDCENDYEAISVGQNSGGNLSTFSGTYGGPTAPGYFNPLI